MLRCFLLYPFCKSRKLRGFLFVFCLSSILILFYQSLFDVQYYNRKITSYFSTFRPCTTEGTSTQTERPSIMQLIKAHNEDQSVRNFDSFGPITNDTIIILIQTHKRKTYLQALIDSLKDSRYINETLLIFSHGSYDEDINEVVRAINFTRVLQIFFPYSLQTYPDSFPRFLPDDSPHDESESMFPTSCFRRHEAFRHSQIKLHWWWKINIVFNDLRITQDFEGLVLFLEEDHYVFPDILHMLKLMKMASIKQCSDCNVFGVGQNPTERDFNYYKTFSEQVSVQQWNNMGFAFTREFWRGLNQTMCKDMFCEYNDHNWDFTLAYLSHKCLPQEIKPLTVVSPRVFHIGDCGMHFYGTPYRNTTSLDKARNLQKLVAKFLFPSQLKVRSTIFQQKKSNGQNGGWNNPCDIRLCKNISSNQY